MVAAEIDTTCIDNVVATTNAAKLAASPLSITTTAPAQEEEATEFRDAGNSSPCSSMRDYADELAASKSLENEENEEAVASGCCVAQEQEVAEERDEPAKEQPEMVDDEEETSPLLDNTDVVEKDVVAQAPISDPVAKKEKEELQHTTEDKADVSSELPMVGKEDDEQDEEEESTESSKKKGRFSHIKLNIPKPHLPKIVGRKSPTKDKAALPKEEMKEEEEEEQVQVVNQELAVETKEDEVVVKEEVMEESKELETSQMACPGFIESLYGKIEVCLGEVTLAMCGPRSNDDNKPIEEKEEVAAQPIGEPKADDTPVDESSPEEESFVRTEVQEDTPAAATNTAKAQKAEEFTNSSATEKLASEEKVNKNEASRKKPKRNLGLKKSFKKLSINSSMKKVVKRLSNPTGLMNRIRIKKNRPIKAPVAAIEPELTKIAAQPIAVEEPATVTEELTAPLESTQTHKEEEPKEEKSDTEEELENVAGQE